MGQKMVEGMREEANYVNYVALLDLMLHFRLLNLELLVLTLDLIAFWTWTSKDRLSFFLSVKELNEQSTMAAANVNSLEPKFDQNLPLVLIYYERAIFCVQETELNA